MGFVKILAIWSTFYFISCFGIPQANDVNGGNVHEPRAYVPDAQVLDYVYHSHEELTKFLR